MMVLASGWIAAQGQGIRNSGIIKYKDLVKTDIQIEGGASDFSHLLTDELTTGKELLFTENAALYRNGEAEAEADESMGGEDVMIRISTSSPEHVIYTDFNRELVVERKEFMTRRFLIEGTLKSQNWKLTGKQKMILELPSQEAVTKVDSLSVTAWFTPVIPVPAGPATFHGLPGLILEVNIDDGAHRIYAEEVELREIDKAELEKPRKGKKVSGEEYEKIVAEKVKEMGGQVEGERMMMITIEEH